MITPHPSSPPPHPRFHAAVSAARPEVPASKLPRLIHMTWLGSPLPTKRFARSIASYVSLNPVR